jgi:hypothetical protein
VWPIPVAPAEASHASAHRSAPAASSIVLEGLSPPDTPSLSLMDVALKEDCSFCFLMKL